MTNRFPHAAAYLRSVAKEGECFSLASDASRRETADAVVPIRSARPAAENLWDSWFGGEQVGLDFMLARDQRSGEDR